MAQPLCPHTTAHLTTTVPLRPGSLLVSPVTDLPPASGLGFPLCSAGWRQHVPPGGLGTAA